MVGVALTHWMQNSIRGAWSRLFSGALHHARNNSVAALQTVGACAIGANRVMPFPNIRFRIVGPIRRYLRNRVALPLVLNTLSRF